MTPIDFPVKAVVFDIGATLVTGPPVAPNKVIARYFPGASAAVIASVIMTCNLDSVHDCLGRLESHFGKPSDEAVKAISELWDSQKNCASEIESATEIVMALKERGIKIGLLSDIWRPYYESVELAIPKIVAAADAIVLSCRTGARKPSHKNFHRVAEELGVEYQDLVMVGDTYTHDILPALELGMRAVWVLARLDREAASVVDVLNGKYPRPTMTVSSINELPELELWSAAEAVKF